jgi:hypothetical protein
MYQGDFCEFSQENVRLVRREIRYTRSDALAVNGNNFPLPLYAVYTEHLDLYMSPVFGKGLQVTAMGVIFCVNRKVS